MVVGQQEGGEGSALAVVMWQEEGAMAVVVWQDEGGCAVFGDRRW